MYFYIDGDHEDMKTTYFEDCDWTSFGCLKPSTREYHLNKCSY